MTWHTGTATDFKDLFTKIKDHMSADGWTIHEYSAAEAAPRTHLLIAEGPGFGVGYENFIGIRTYEAAASNYYCFETVGYTDYDMSLTWDTQPGKLVSPVITRLWNSTIKYWLSVTDRRIMLVAKCSNTYHSLYAGFINAFANPIEYPYPMYIASDAATYGTFGNTDFTVRAAAFPGEGAGYVRDPSGVWRNVTVYGGTNQSSGIQGYDLSRYIVWPYAAPGIGNNQDDDVLPGRMSTPHAAFEELPGVAGSLFLQNCYLMGCGDNLGVLGALEGVFYTPGNTVAAEQEYTIGADTYLVSIAISRSLESPTQFYAVKEA